MEPTTALQRNNEMRFDVRPKSNQLTAIGNAMDDLAAVHSRGVEAATAASTHAGHEEGKRSSNHRGQPHRRKLQKISIHSADLDGQLNFEFARNKNSMNVFMIRLRRVYQA